jgi:RsiW-degrading membrane proteinase PrsW (M82 family)
MTDNRDPLAMPVPRDHDDLTFSEMVPFRSSKIDLKRSPALYFLLLLALTVPILFSAADSIFSAGPGMLGKIRNFALLITFVICAALQTMLFMYARTDRSFMHFWFAFVAVCGILLSPLLGVYFYIFRTLWPFYNPQATSFIAAFLSHFSGAGLAEELIKATPILIGAWIGYRAQSNPALRDNKLASLIAVRGPLDGIIMGVFAGGGFTFLETGMQYVPDTAQMVAAKLQNDGLGIAAAFLLLIPRALGAAVGHMAYAGIFGYFIGLAVMRPKNAVKLLAIGWLSAATVHALWNSVSQINENLYHVVAAMAAVGLVSVLLKARQLDGVAAGRIADSFGSIVVDHARPASALAPAPAYFAPPVVPPVSAPATADALALDVEGMQIPLRANGSFDLSTEPALGGRGAGVTGTIVPHPTRANVLGLRNSGTVPWTARLRDGSQQQIDREQNIRLAPGITIAFGNGLFGSVVKLG